MAGSGRSRFSPRCITVVVSRQRDVAWPSTVRTFDARNAARHDECLTPRRRQVLFCSSPALKFRQELTWMLSAEMRTTPARIEMCTSLLAVIVVLGTLGCNKCWCSRSSMPQHVSRSVALTGQKSAPGSSCIGAYAFLVEILTKFTTKLLPSSYFRTTLHERSRDRSVKAAPSS